MVDGAGKISDAADGLRRRLEREVSGEVLFDIFSRGRYATDASIYQMMPVGVVVPETLEDVQAAMAAARDAGIPVLPRGGGTSQCGQTVNRALVIDTSKHLNRIVELDPEGRRCRVEPGIVLDELNRALKPHGLWFPVDVSTASRATIGGMTGNNSCGGRSIRYGTMRDNVHAIEAVLADGSAARFGETDAAAEAFDLVRDMLVLGSREADEIQQRFPDVMRRVGGYNIDALVPTNRGNNLAHLLVGSEGTLAYSTSIELALSPLVGDTVMGVCHFGSFHAAMDAAQHLVTLDPIAVELIDATMIGLARDIDIFRPTVERAVKGEPDALLVVEFAEQDRPANLAKLDRLEELMGDIGFSWTGEGKRWGGVVRAEEKPFQSAISEMRKSGLNIMMSMKEAGKPVSFVEDCAVPLPHLADYTARLTDIFEKHGTSGTWYAHASVGCLHVRPILNMKKGGDVAAMRAIAEEAFEMVRGYKGSHSGEHGDGIVRSEFHEAMFGRRMVDAFAEVKERFDPGGVLNPGKIVDAPAMDDRSLFRYSPDYRAEPIETRLDWSAWPGAGGGFQGAVEMCNNNGACRKLKGGVMCPSYRVTRNERDLTRGRANSLRLAITGQLGPDALASEEMAETMKLCVSCKGCKRECPTGVDMARMKIEVEAARAARHGLTLHDRLVGELPRYAPMAARFSALANLRNRVPVLARLLEGPTGFAASMKLPEWRADYFRDAEFTADGEPQALLFGDCFNRFFEPENLRAALRVMKAAGLRPAVARPSEGGRPLCCGRTYLSSGMAERARVEGRRLLEALLPHARRGMPIAGIEPSCLLTLRDELPGLLPGEEAKTIAATARLLDEALAERSAADLRQFRLRPPAPGVLVHGHCHRKAHGAMPALETVLGLIPDMPSETVETSCCGMAGAFGYGEETHEIGRAMGELDLLPAIRRRDPGVLVVADGFSCRHRIADGTDAEPLHPVRVLDMALQKV